MGQKAKQEKRRALEARTAARHDDSRIGRANPSVQSALNSAANNSQNNIPHNIHGDQPSPSFLPYIEGTTFDKAGTILMDDGFAICKKPNGWRLQVSIVDMPSLIADGSEMEKEASRLRIERKGHDDQVQRIFPYGLLRNKASFRPGEKSPSITFDLSLDNDLNVTASRIYRAGFINRSSYSFNAADEKAMSGRAPELATLLEFGQRLYAKRMNDALACMKQNLGIGDAYPLSPVDCEAGIPKSKRLIQEITHLANGAAAAYLIDHKIPAPFLRRVPEIQVMHVSPSYDFDRRVNELTDRIGSKIMGDVEANIRVTSPMRRYNEFLGLKIIAAHIDGRKVSAFTANMTKSLSAEFRAAAGSPLLDTAWERQWQYELRRQTCGQGTPAAQDGADIYMALRYNCKVAKVPPPVVSMRKIETAHMALYLVGIAPAAVPGMGDAEPAWGVGCSAADAMAMAADQFRRYGMPANANGCKASPGPQVT